jgi:hypothetical protein
MMQRYNFFLNCQAKNEKIYLYFLFFLERSILLFEMAIGLGSHWDPLLWMLFSWGPFLWVRSASADTYLEITWRSIPVGSIGRRFWGLTLPTAVEHPDVRAGDHGRIQMGSIQRTEGSFYFRLVSERKRKSPLVWYPTDFQ